MKEFLSDILRFSHPERFVIVENPDSSAIRRYIVKPRRLLLLFCALICVGVLLLTAFIQITVPQEILPDYVSNEIRSDVRLANTRLIALEDSLEMYTKYVEQLRRVLTGDLDSPQATAGQPPDGQAVSTNGSMDAEPDPLSDNWMDHRQPAVPLTHLPTHSEASIQQVTDGQPCLPSFQAPTMPPVTGFVTRGFEPQAGHYAIDIATQEGTLVRSVGNGYVILADWTQKGGYSIAVQHADGFVSIYKHNARLLKHVADRVQLREVVAVSGNSGEYTTGPHLHFELWNNGLAQDPQLYLLGL